MPKYQGGRIETMLAKHSFTSDFRVMTDRYSVNLFCILKNNVKLRDLLMCLSNGHIISMCHYVKLMRKYLEVIHLIAKFAALNNPYLITL